MLRFSNLRTDLPCQKEKGLDLPSKEIIFLSHFQTFLKYIFFMRAHLYYGTESENVASSRQVILTERPSRLFLLNISRPFWVFMRLRKPLFLNLFTLLHLLFSILFFLITYDNYVLKQFFKSLTLSHLSQVKSGNSRPK
jgi:hypothetical protein